MSRAFVKENDEQGNELPERPQSPYPNHITPRGLDALHQQLESLEAAHKRMAEPQGNELIDQDAKHGLGQRKPSADPDHRRGAKGLKYG